MRAFIDYWKAYLRSSSRPALFLTILFIAALVTANYSIGIEARIRALHSVWLSLGAYFLFYGIVLAVVWGLQAEWKHTRLRQSKLLVILALAPLYFSLKMVHWDLHPLLPRTLLPPWDHYMQLILQLPLKLLLLLALIFVLHRLGVLRGSGMAAAVGLTRKNFNARTYFYLLLLTVPLVVLASTRPDFLHVYPKVKNYAFIDAYAHPAWPWKLLYEISYGLDFLGIELFFRGVLVVALLEFVGPDAILPMAAFYCTIHFGKPLAECISSFFGGLILGILAARTRTILGGLIVHLGLAWLMELGGWLGAIGLHRLLYL